MSSADRKTDGGKDDRNRTNFRKFQDSTYWNKQNKSSDSTSEKEKPNRKPQN